jgi:hypothetical protein
MKRDTTVGFAYLGVHLLLLGFIAFPTVLLAGGKEYPIQGTVIALGTSQETTGGGSTSVFTHVHRTYTVRTPTPSLRPGMPLLDGRLSHSLAK